MMKPVLLPTVALAFMAATSAPARDDCDSAIATWQPREAVRAMAEDRGWRLKRIKIDDGCYEVYGTDRQGHRFEAKIDPVTLKIIEIENEDEER